MKGISSFFYGPGNAIARVVYGCSPHSTVLQHRNIKEYNID